MVVLNFQGYVLMLNLPFLLSPFSSFPSLGVGVRLRLVMLHDMIDGMHHFVQKEILEELID